MAKSRQVREIRVKADVRGARGLRSISRNLGRVRKDVGGLRKTVGGLRNAFAAIAGFSFAGIGLGALVRASDDIQLLRDRVAGLEGDVGAARDRLDGLAGVAGRTGASINDLATIYARLGVALGDAGISGDALLEVTEVLRNSFRLFGASAAEARGATIQLSQGLASGQFRGQELRSVLEANAEIGTLLAAQFEGIGRGDLIKFSEERGGFSTVEVLTALAEGQEDVNRRASELNLTIEQGLSRSLNQLKLNLLDVNTEFGATVKINKALQVAVDNLSVIIAAAGVALGLFAAKLILTSKALAVVTAAALSFGKAFLVSAGIIGIGGAFAGALKYLIGLLANPYFLGAAVVVGAIGLAVKKLDPEKFNQMSSAISQFVTGTENISDRAAVSIDKTFGKGGSIPGPVEDTGDQFRNLFDNMGIGLREVQIPLAGAGEKISALQATVERLKDGQIKEGDALKVLNARYKELNEDNLDEYIEKLKQIKIINVRNKADLGDYNRIIEEQKIKAIKSGEALGLQSNIMGSLNQAVKATSISVETYNSKVDDLKRKDLNKNLEEGTIKFREYQRSIAEIQIRELNREFAEGDRSLSSLNEEIEKKRLVQLKNQFDDGTMSAREFNREVNSLESVFSPDSALFQGVDDYLRQSGTLAQNIAGNITLAFNTLEDTLVEFTKTGRLEFKKFTQAILEDLNRIIIRQSIIRPLASGILGGLGGEGGGGTVPSFRSDPGLVAAKGAVFNKSGVEAFAKGGIVSSPTLFGFGGGRTGLMGEEGPEAVVPLKRTSSGDLGVQATPPNVNVNIINNSGAQIEQRERTDNNGQRSIDVIVTNSVKKGFANGSFDKQLNQQYGIRRKGF